MANTVQPDAFPNDLLPVGDGSAPCGLELVRDSQGRLFYRRTLPKGSPEAKRLRVLRRLPASKQIPAMLPIVAHRVAAGAEEFLFAYVPGISLTDRLAAAGSDDALVRRVEEAKTAASAAAARTGIVPMDDAQTVLVTAADDILFTRFAAAPLRYSAVDVLRLLLSLAVVGLVVFMIVRFVILDDWTPELSLAQATVQFAFACAIWILPLAYFLSPKRLLRRAFPASALVKDGSAVVVWFGLALGLFVALMLLEGVVPLWFDV